MWTSDASLVPHDPENLTHLSLAGNSTAVT